MGDGQADVRRLVFEVLEGSWPVYLTTVDGEGRPRTRAMMNLRNRERFTDLGYLFEDDPLLLLFTTNTSSAKVGDLRTNAAASAYYCLVEEWRGLMLGGEVEVVDDPGIRRAIWHDGWEMYYPSGYDDPDHTVLRMRPTVARGWDGGSTFELDLG